MNGLEAAAANIADYVDEALGFALEQVTAGLRVGGDPEARDLRPSERESGETGCDPFAFGWLLGRAELRRETLGDFDGLTLDDLGAP